MQILFVCSGNTCRSPMAEYLFNQGAKAMGLGWRAASAGLLAGAGPMSGGALRALQRRGVDGSPHRARQATAAMVREADLVICMSPAHRDGLWALCPGAAVSLLGGNGIRDPYGGPQSLYDSIMELIAQEVDGLLLQLQSLERGREY